MKKNTGSYLVEAMIAISMVGLLSISFLPLFPKLLLTIDKVQTYTRLYSIGEYVGDYVHRWADFSPLSKAIPLSSYKDGDDLELSGETRVNRLLWAQFPETKTDYLTDHYKTTITFWETSPRVFSTVAAIKVWYDSDLDNILDDDELFLDFSTIITEKRNI
jgi:hypothetical protein